jgi:N-acetylmuramic acid 6-phosphate etherase
LTKPKDKKLNKDVTVIVIILPTLPNISFMSKQNLFTEQESNHNSLETKSLSELLSAINQEDQTVAHSVQKSIKQIEHLSMAVFEKMALGGRLFYIGAGTSGRLAIVDASECPPTFGLPQGRVVALIAGGDAAIRVAVENAEDDPNQAYQDLLSHQVSKLDMVVGVAASGSTPYVLGGLKKCRETGISTGCIVCNLNTPMAQHADYPVEVVVGPEFITGSTRMKAGTAQKLVLNMLSTTVMIQLGHVKGNKMIDMQLSNQKLRERALRMVMEETGLSTEMAAKLLEKFGSVRKAIENAHYQ